MHEAIKHFILNFPGNVLTTYTHVKTDLVEKVKVTYLFLEKPILDFTHCFKRQKLLIENKYRNKKTKSSHFRIKGTTMQNFFVQCFVVLCTIRAEKLP